MSINRRKRPKSKKIPMKVSPNMILQLPWAVKKISKFGFLDFDPSFKNHALFFLEHPFGSKVPGPQFSTSNMNCAKIWGLSDQTGRIQSKNSSGGVIMTSSCKVQVLCLWS